MKQVMETMAVWRLTMSIKKPIEKNRNMQAESSGGFAVARKILLRRGQRILDETRNAKATEI